MELPQTPPRRIARRDTASSLLSKFLPGAKTEHKMDAQKWKENTTPKAHGSNNPPPPIDLVITPTKSVQDPDEDESSKALAEDDNEIQFAPVSRSGRKLRPRSSVPFSLKALEDGDKQSRFKTPRSSRKKNVIDEVIGVDIPEYDFSPIVSERVLIRQEIASQTAANRSRFFVDKKDYFLPLLPPNNHVKKLVEKHEQLSEEEISKLPIITPYEELETQPRGIQAKMKPYQLSGLSFMVYLHRNGLSGILGDEMGLGKTLQTISLIQYLKENDPKRGTGRLQRPFLVICPLSVLSSWMSETKKWAPTLKVIRFHGPVKERVRLKKIIVGEIDMYGNLTSQARTKQNAKNTASRQNSHSRIGNEGEDVGVDVVVTTYESYASEQSWFKKAFVWRYVVLDEGHKVKNDQSLISKSLQGLTAEYRLILTGTPLQNNLSEAWALLHWLYPEVFLDNTSELFNESFNLTKGLYSNTVLDNLRHLLELIMLRRMKTSPGVDLNLPSKTEILLFVPLSPMQRFWYTRLITRADQGLLDELFRGAKDKEVQAMEATKKNEEIETELMKRETAALETLEEDLVVGGDVWKESRDILKQTIQREFEDDNDDAGNTKKSSWQKLMNLLMQLRKVCNHPYQISYPEDTVEGDHIITASGKFIVLEKLLNQLVIKQKKKILIFSGFTKMLDLVEELLMVRGGDGTSYRYVRLDGSTARARRNLGIRMFNDTNSEYRVMLISTRAGGLGVNLATASDVVLLDQDWNPQITLQAEARAHRIGQKNPVTIFKLVSQGTVEEQMMGRIQKKLYLSAKVTEAMQDIHTKSGIKSGKGRGRTATKDEDMPQLGTSQLMALVRRGASAISRPEIDVGEMLSWDWETTVEKCKDQPADINVKRDALPDARVDEEAEKKWLTEMEKVEASVFEGKKMNRGIRASGSYNEIAQEWRKEDRRIGKNTTVMIDGFAVSKESLNCAQWEAVPTLAGKDPRLAEPKRAKKAVVNSQSHCQICFDGGDLNCCQLCPRAFHFECLDRDFKVKAKGWQFNCPQHECQDCEQKTTDAGGMLYRCRWCERAYCEDCLDFENAILYGNNIPEYENLGYPDMTQAFYVQCHSCTDHLAANPDNQVFCDQFAEFALSEHKELFGIGGELGASNGNASTRAGSMTDATTVETPGVKTPLTVGDDDYEETGSKRKLKIKIQTTRPAKKGKKM
ncbi:Chromatin structure-remodeling complex subunit snf21 [Phlyctema vagabunda]|uniref:Chromatin structure-remodeling complex subunit snf21 n=1 Tax=Phlyctema vagabunda TaxID=108571 RepID=A0ABR4PVI2_9HELO